MHTALLWALLGVLQPATALLLSPARPAVGRAPLTLSAGKTDAASNAERPVSRRSFIGHAGLLAGLAVTAAARPAGADPVPEGGFEVAKGSPFARGMVSYDGETKGPSGEAAVVSFIYPSKWTVSRATGISVQDYRTTDKAYQLVIALPEDAKDPTVESLPLQYFYDAIFDINGPYGTYGKVEDMKLLQDKVEARGKRDYRYMDLTFGAITPGGIQSQRRSCVAATVLGRDCYMFVSSIQGSRWAKVADEVATMMVSYRASKAAPKEESLGKALKELQLRQGYTPVD